MSLPGPSGQRGELIGRHGDALRYRVTRGQQPTVVFLGGFRSDMSGLKARMIERLAAQRGHGALVLDYSGHGESGGRFETGCISRWCDDAAEIIEAAAGGPLVLVGSSMGGWIMTLLARRLASRVAGVLGIASAPDFTEGLYNDRLDAQQRAEVDTDGLTWVDSAYGDGPYPITRALIEDGRAHGVLGQSVPVSGPVRLIHGLADPDVPWQRSVALADAIVSEDVRIELIKGGGHRLSEPSELDRIAALLLEITDATATPD